MDPKAMFKLTYGLFVLTTKVNDQDNGCIINTAIQAASTPNQMSICVNKANYTHDMIKDSKEFTVSVISEDASFDLFKRFGFQSGRTVNKFDGFEDMKRGDNGIYYITKGTNAFISVKVEKMEDLGSHTMFIGTITDMQVLSDVNSVTYVYYLNNIKPKPEAVKTTPEGKTIWRCRICGYEYEGEELPEDFICPICKHPASDFDKVVIAPVEEKQEEIKEEKNMKVFQCDTCGTMVEEIKLGGCHPSCCGHPMTELVPGTSDGAVEKHVPVVDVDGYIVNVKVGEVAHPMVDVHYIEWIAVETTKGVHRIHLQPGEEPKAMVIMSQQESFVAAYAYCNLHGLWKA